MYGGHYRDILVCIEGPRGGRHWWHNIHGGNLVSVHLLKNDPTPHGLSDQLSLQNGQRNS